MTENSKIPPTKKTIQDPPEYAAAPGEATYQQNGQTAITPSAENVALEDPSEIPMGDWLGGPQNGAEAPKEKKAPKGSLTGGGVDAQEGGGPDV